MSRIVFVHPDLGIGGAERLVIDAALSLRQKGYIVQFITSHHDPNHCFPETRNDLEVTVVGDWIPRHIFHYFHAFLAYLRMIYCALYLVFFSGLKVDLIICDQVSIAVPIFKWAGWNVIFYCHFPDQLLSSPGSGLKKLYRAPLNYLEEITTAKADRLLVNSEFTREVFKKTFKNIQTVPDILYPSLNTNFFDSCVLKGLDDILPSPVNKNSLFFLSINRYDRKKNLTLALQSFNELKDRVSLQDWEKVHLIIAGGYDLRVTENVEYFTELVQFATNIKLEDKITFLKSPSDIEKVTLLSSCSCLLYTPSNEHFGIVPLEAMYMKKPVIAVNSGGPKETVVNGDTGFLCEADACSFANAMAKLIEDDNLLLKFGTNGRSRVINRFSFKSFSYQINEIVSSLLNADKES